MLGGSGGFGSSSTWSNGADTTIGSIAVSSSTTGNLTLFQKAIGGDSEGGNGASAGLAGNASSTMNLAQNGVATLTLQSIAEAGSGGAAEHDRQQRGHDNHGGSLASSSSLIAGAFANSDQFGNNNQQRRHHHRRHVWHRQARQYGDRDRRGHWHHGRT